MSFFEWLVVGVLVLVVLAGFYLMLRPLLRLLVTVGGATWHGRADLNPSTPQGRWRLLGIAGLLVGILLAWQARQGDSAISIFALLGGVLVVAYFSGRCLAYAKRFDARPASEVLAEDARPPVLYLRSFGDDDKAAHRIGMAGFSVNTEEGEIAEIVKRIGPLVAIGRPGEELSYFGAARVYVGEGDWHEQVRGLLSKAKVVILRAGETAGLSWELQQCVKVVRPERLIILIPFGRQLYDEFCLKSANLFPRRLPQYNGRRVGQTTVHAILYFDAAWTPHLLPIIESYLSYYLRLALDSWLGEAVFYRKQSKTRLVLENALQPLLERSV